MESNADKAAAARGIQNVAQACTYCKSRHSKCDGQVPCSQCVRRGRGSECSYSVVRKRGPKPKKDLYEYCNKLLVELEVQKQIAEYWKDQFVQAMKGKEDGSMPLGLPAPGGTPGGPLLLDPNRPKFSIERVPSPGDDMDDMEITTSTNSTGPTAGDSRPTSVSPNFSPHLVKSESATPPPQSLNGSSSSNAILEDIPPIDLEIASEIAFSFLSAMLPVIPELSFVPSLTFMLEAYNSNRVDFEAIPVDDYHHLVALLEAAVIGAFGARSNGHGAHMRHFARKAEELMHVLFFQREVQTRADVANRLVGALVLLSSYYAGDEREGSKQSVIMLAYQIVSLHRKQIPAAAMFRIYTVMMGLADTQEDRVYWNEQSNSVVREASMDLIVAQIFSNLIFVLSSLHPKLSWGKPYPSFSAHEITQLQEKLLTVDHFIAMIPPSRETARLRDFYDAVAVIKLMYIAARVEIHFLRGEYDYAKRLIYADAILASTFIRPAIYTYMYGIAGPVEVAMHLNMPIKLLREFYITLVKVKDVMPGAVRLFNQVADFIQRNDPQASRFFASVEALRQTITDEQRIERNEQVNTLLQQCPVAVQNLSPSFLTHKSALEMFRPRLPGLIDATVMAMELLRRRISDEVAASSGRSPMAQQQQILAPGPFAPTQALGMMQTSAAYGGDPQQHQSQQNYYMNLTAQQQQQQPFASPGMAGSVMYNFDPSAMSPGFQPMGFSTEMPTSANLIGGMPQTPPTLLGATQQHPHPAYGFAPAGAVDIETFFNANVVSSEFDL